MPSRTLSVRRRRHGYAATPRNRETPTPEPRSLRSGCRNAIHRITTERSVRSSSLRFATPLADERQNGCDLIRRSHPWRLAPAYYTTTLPPQSPSLHRHVAPTLALSPQLRLFHWAARGHVATSLPLAEKEHDSPSRTNASSLVVHASDERRSPSDRGRLVGRAPRSPVLHGLALRTRRSGMIPPLAPCSFQPALVRSVARSFRSIVVHPAYFALLGRRVPRRLVARSAARSHETGAGHASRWRPTVSATRFSAREAATSSDAFVSCGLSAQKTRHSTLVRGPDFAPLARRRRSLRSL